MTIAVVAVVPSERVAGKSYEIRRNAAGELTCSCVAFGYSKVSPPTCKHLTAWALAQLAPADALPMMTFTGRVVYPLAPTVDDIAIEDIAHALAAVNRFNGHTREPYSVAQHSVLVSSLCGPEDALHGLLHDAAEAYCTDLPRPLKQLPALEPYRQIESVWQAVILRRFGLRADEMPAAIKAIDEQLVVNEAQDLLPVVPAWAANGTRAPLPERIAAWPPAEAEARFLARFRELRRRRRAA